MAQALAFVLPSVFGVGASAALVTATGLTLTGSLVSVAGSLAFNALVSNALSPDIGSSKPQNIKLNLSEAIGARKRHYGRVQVGGTKVFYRAKEGVLYALVVHGHGEITEVEGYQLNKSLVTLDPLGHVTDDQYQYYGPRVQLLSRLGTVPSAHYSQITAIWPEFTSDHRLDGLWTTLMIAKSVPPEEFRRVYPNNVPTILPTGKGVKVHDPRLSSEGFSANASVVIADFVSHPDGLNRPDLIDQTYLSHSADTSDEPVALAGGGVQPRYELHGSYVLNESPRSSLKRFLDSCAGELKLLPNGKLRVHVGRYEAPTVTIGFSDILELSSIENGPDKLDRYNELNFTYVDQSLNFTQATGDPWVNQDQVDVDGEILPQAIDFEHCATHTQARRVAKIRQSRDNPKTIIALRCKPSALEAIYERVVELSVPLADFSGEYYVKNFQVDPQSCVSTLLLYSVDVAAYSFTIEEEGKKQELPPADIATGVPVPNIISAAAAGIQSSQATSTAGIGLAFSAPPSDALSSLVQYTISGQSDWIVVPTSSTTTQLVISGLEDGVNYDISVSYVTPSGQVGEPDVATSITAAAETVVPLAPSSFSVVDLSGGVAEISLVTWSSSSLWKTEIYRDGSLVARQFGDPGETITITDSSGPGIYSWTAKSFNVSGGESPAAGPITQTIS